VLVERGVVQACYSNNPDIEIGILDLDNYTQENDPEMIEYYEKLEKEIDCLIPIY
jgi:hypothetical protein